MSAPAGLGDAPSGVTLLAPISVGELLDKISILMLKAERLTDGGQIANVSRELEALRALRAASGLAAGFEDLFAALLDVNGRLWHVEDELRRLEALQCFDASFIALARSVYRLNDARAALKRRINLQSGSWLVEEKGYSEHP
ncbi:DUF6165 family protein [Xanthobacter agilis]|jgi:hypothetical protein|uniref:Uncharacterized protein n=1 Tax=Xanthobacter agilis TaxID=47492 RepID=A0ABU0LIG2_XANAG|nr:DUF6165 family protein [Xanthobacter agilis]MDQ0506928.1 hypothetical protein [Xanthobacter agilis]